MKLTIDRCYTSLWFTLTLGYFCGAVKHADGLVMSPDIVQGHIALPGQFPYQAQMHYEHRFCGGSLISDRHILTAAHCVAHVLVDSDVPKIEIYLGSVDLKQGTLYRARRVSRHMNYTHKPLANDIAIIQLAKQVEFTKEIQKIGLPTGELADRSDVVMSGFGIDKLRGGHLSKHLKYLETKTIPWEACRIRSTMKLPEGAICADSVPIDKEMGLYDGNCEGDSGGPLATEDKKTVVGAFSAFQWGPHTRHGCKSRKPNVFTRVYHYMDYINSELNYYTEHPYEQGQHPSQSSKDAE